jgi:hypothetical protein
MHLFAALLALLIGICGWYYLLFSKAAARLGGIEDAAINRRRAVLRRVNGGVMFLLAWGFYAGFFAVDAQRTPHAFVAVWLSVLLLLLAIVLLAVADLRYTTRLRRRPRP